MKFLYCKNNSIFSFFCFAFSFLFFYIYIFHRDLRRDDVIQRAHYMAYNKYDKIRVNKHIFSSVIYTQFYAINIKSTRCVAQESKKYTNKSNTTPASRNENTRFSFSILQNS